MLLKKEFKDLKEKIAVTVQEDSKKLLKLQMSNLKSKIRLLNSQQKADELRKKASNRVRTKSPEKKVREYSEQIATVSRRTHQAAANYGYLRKLPETGSFHGQRLPFSSNNQIHDARSKAFLCVSGWQPEGNGSKLHSTTVL